MGARMIALAAGGARALREVALFPGTPRLAYARSMTATPTDAALMRKFKDGDVAAFETLYRRHNDGLFRYFLGLCLNRATAEDLYQEVWSRIIKARLRYRPTAKFTTYLYRIAHNCFVDHLRRNRRYGGGTVEPQELADSAPSPEEEVERTLARSRLLAALEHLPAEQRDVFLLREEAGLSLDDIATVTGVNRETAKSRLRYANRKLTAALTARSDRPAVSGGGSKAGN